MNKSVRLLVIDDSDADKLHLSRALNSSGFLYELTELADATSLEEISSQVYDCIFLNYLIDNDNGLLLLNTLRGRGNKTPIIVIISHNTESAAPGLIRAGATDYINKSEISGHSLGKVIRNILKVNEIVSARQDAESALQTSELRLAELERIAQIGNWEFNVLNNNFYCSSQIYQILGIQNSYTATVDKFLEYIHPDDIELVQSTWKHVFSEASINISFRVTTSSGNIKYVNVFAYATRNKEVIETIRGTLQDITEKKLAELEIVKSKELSENSMKVREIFLANMSHEIRTPMNAIVGFTRLLYETELSKEQKSFIDAIHFSGENLLAIINDILDLSKIQSGKMMIEKSEFNLQELVAGIISVLRPKAREKALQLNSKIDQHIPSVLKGDPLRLNQILTNLVSNGIKFTERGSVALEVNLVTSEDKEILLEFKVKDTGIGIPQDKQALIFEDFVQGSSDATREFGGTGLGLAIVKNLVELQDGKVSLHSQVGIGSTFIVHLPYEKVNQDAVYTSESPAKDESLELLRGADVLVVEDNAVNQLLVKKVLDKMGCNIDIATTGREALDCVRENRYDVILMDVQMPEMDGNEATRQIRKMPSPIADTPIIAMTAQAFASDVSECIAAGMNDYLSKPFKPQDLYAKILKYIAAVDHTKVISLNQKGFKIDLNVIFELGNGDSAFINELILVYDKQTPAFVEKLRAYTKSHNFAAIKSVCHQIKSSYGILKMDELDRVLIDINAALEIEKPDAEIGKITSLVNVIISLISAINEEVKRELRKTG